MFTPIAQSAGNVLVTVGRFAAPAAKQGAKIAIKGISVAATTAAVAVGTFATGVAGYGVYRGTRFIGRATIKGAVSSYNWAASETSTTKKALEARIARMSAELEAAKAAKTTGKPTINGEAKEIHPEA